MKPLTHTVAYVPGCSHGTLMHSWLFIYLICKCNIKECPDQQKVLKPITVMRPSGMYTCVEVFGCILCFCVAVCVCSCDLGMCEWSSLWWLNSLLLFLSQHFLQLELSECQNSWLLFLHPQKPLMCAASSCASMGQSPIRNHAGLLWLNIPRHWTVRLNDMMTLSNTDNKMALKMKCNKSSQGFFLYSAILFVFIGESFCICM